MNKFQLARDHQTKPEDLSILALDKSDRIRYLVAKNPNTPSETLRLLALGLVLMTNTKQNKKT
jgi:hypothetical protein